MIEEHRKVYRVSLSIVLVAAAAFLPFNRAVSLSLLLGIILYYVYLLILTKTVTAQLDAALEGRCKYAFGYALRVAVLALPLLIAAKFPQYLSIVAAFMPLFINHLVTFVVYGHKGAESL